MNKFISNFVKTGFNIGNATFNQYSYELNNVYIDKKTYVNIKYSYYSVTKIVQIIAYYKKSKIDISRKCSLSYNLLNDELIITEGQLFDAELTNLKRYMEIFKLLIDVNVLLNTNIPTYSEFSKFSKNPCGEEYLTENKFYYLP